MSEADSTVAMTFSDSKAGKMKARIKCLTAQTAHRVSPQHWEKTTAGNPKTLIVEDDTTVTIRMVFSNASHQFSDGCLQRFGYGLNCKKTWIFQAALDTAQKCAVNVGFSGQSLLRQLSLRADFPNPLAESFGNVMAHSRLSCLFMTVAGCRLYTTKPIDNRWTRGQNRQRVFDF